uniref:Uncharacterized protein n=1 Tax=Anguilla anguilla TaxID=7936 RepID=A0A0E9PPI0_ANGAN
MLLTPCFLGNSISHTWRLIFLSFAHFTFFLWDFGEFKFEI